MTHRFYILNGLRLVLLLVFVLSASQLLKGMVVLALVGTLVFDIVEYRREKERLAAEEEDSGEHVPLPPQYRHQR